MSPQSLARLSAYYMVAALVAASLSSVWPNPGRQTEPAVFTVAAGETDAGR
ncbi:hypothetical protein [Ciceribacter ferrooxidans]|uniref:hypothetical protein n=1 Tax=Ciceribacter ferrooxidans TaxID=2509717 RepID=UPI0013EAF07D|nr:hypothetical protein [Ciceribacter ferrooxidans]